ncbi:glutathione S-transferase family protein [Halotalea alkalilenta]|uniref:glutathione S-transferase family protein n=1 Tax=Halotalea alkalilenta TaxID=376489 RepID=UPI000487FE88|nr:glutathione S-transferase N-terminal domain-containing protein [Halotalea alkalilenta]
MRLIGMLDSPYVRRTAISLRRLGIAFELEQLSVFSEPERFGAINPLFKVPTLVCDDATVLIDSGLIILHAERLAASQSLTPAAPADALRDLRITGLALAACEKAVQRIYEQRLRPEEKRHAPWIERIDMQLAVAWRELEQELAIASPPLDAERATHGAIALAVAWRFCSVMLPEWTAGIEAPRLRAFSAAAERLDDFRAFDFDSP